MSRSGVTMHQGAARDLSSTETEPVHLFCANPLDGSLRSYPDHKVQSGNVPVYDEFLEEMDLPDGEVPFRLG